MNITELSNDECRLLHDTIAERAEQIRVLLPELRDVAGIERVEDAEARMGELRTLAAKLWAARVWITKGEGCP